MNAVAAIIKEGPTSKDRWALLSEGDIGDTAPWDLAGEKADALNDKEVALCPKT